MSPRKKPDPYAKQASYIIPHLEVNDIAQILLNSPDLEQYLAASQPKQEKTYPTDPVEFMTHVLGYQMWDKLEQICRSVEHNKNTVVESGFGVGKSVVAASLICWYMSTRKPAITVILGPSHNTVQNILFRYIRTAGRKAGLPGTILDSPRWEINSDHYAIGLSPKRASEEDVATIQGIHGENVLVVLDEAAGLPKLVWDAAAGLVVGNNCRMLAIGNPIEQAGAFWDACNSKSWYHIRISAFEHPNVVQGQEVIPGAVTRGWIEERIDDGWATKVELGTSEATEVPWTGEWYRPTPIFTAKVLGIAPEQSEDQLISLAWVVDAQDRVIDERNAEIVIGFDPAPRGGDDNAMCVRRGNKVLRVRRFKSQDTQQLAEWLALEISETHAIKAYVEDMGSGAGVVDKGRRMGLPIVAVNTGRRATQNQRFANLRAEIWWRVRELLREGKMQLPANDTLLAGDLTAPKYKPDNYGRILIEDKEDIRSRLSRSPDAGDALALSYAIPMAETNDEVAYGNRDLLPQEGGNWTGSRWLIQGVNKKSRWRRH